MRTIELPPLTFRAEVADVNEDDRTIDLIFSTGAGVTRTDYDGKRYIEVLSLEPKHVRLERLNTAGVLLDSHAAFSISDVIGAVVPGSARIINGQAVARVRFSRRDTVDPIFQDVLDDIIRSVSVGYRVHKFEEKAGTPPTRTAVDWEPYELSLVSMPADVGAHVRNGVQTNRCELVMVTDRVDSSAEADAERNRRLERAKAGYAAW